MSEKIKLSDLKKSNAEKRSMMATGFRNVDTALGYRIYDDITGQFSHVNRGILSGSLITVIGVSHVGKSALCSQWSVDLVKSYILNKDERVKIHVFDTEGGVNRERFRVTSKLTREQLNNHVIFHNTPTVEAVKKVILDDITFKSDKNYEMMQTKNHIGEPVLMYHPTVILIDSVTKLVTDKVVEIKNDTTNAMYMQVAGEIDRFLKQNGLKMQEYNITLITTAHTGKDLGDISNPMARPKRKWRYLPASLSIKAPDSMVYDGSIGIYLDTIIAKDPEGVEKAASWLKGSKSIISGIIYKSRQPGEGATFTLVQDETGFDPLKSFLFNCQQNGILQSKPGYREVEGYGKVKNDEIMSTFIKDPSFRQALFQQYDALYDSKLDSSKLTVEDVNISNEIYNLMMDEF